MSRPKSMFRYLENYVGKYRVVAPYDLSLEDFPRDDKGSIEESFDDLYIPCRKGVIKHTYEPGKLYWYTTSAQQGHNIYKELLKKYPDLEIEAEEVGSYDYLLFFSENDLDKIAEIVQPRTSGAKIKPFSDKNLPKVPYTIPEKDNKKFNAMVEDMDKITKMQFIRRVCYDFDPIIQEKKGKKYDLISERKKSRLKPKMFIHSIGMWDDFIEFVKQEKKALIKD